MKSSSRQELSGLLHSSGALAWLQGHLGVQLWGTAHQSPGQVAPVASAQGRGCRHPGGTGTAQPLLRMCTPNPRAPLDCRALLLSLRGTAKPSGLFFLSSSEEVSRAHRYGQHLKAQEGLCPSQKPPAEPGDRILGISGAAGQFQVALVFWEQVWLGFFQCRSAAGALLPPWVF